MNVKELVSIGTARNFAAALTKQGIGGGVAPEAVNADGTPNLEAWATSGVYLLPWDAVEGAAQPQIGDRFPYQVHFNNGVANMNIGDMMDMFGPTHGRTTENTWAYIKEQVDGIAKLQGGN